MVVVDLTELLLEELGFLLQPKLGSQSMPFYCDVARNITFCFLRLSQYIQYNLWEEGCTEKWMVGGGIYFGREEVEKHLLVTEASTSLVLTYHCIWDFDQPHSPWASVSL